MEQSIDEFRAKAREWLTANVPKEVPPHAGPAARAAALAWQREQAAGGWAGLSWPKEFGGYGLSITKQIVWYEEYARAGGPSPLDCSFVGLNHAAPTLMACGTPEQRALHLPMILRGEVIWCQGFSEPNAGSDLASIRTKGRIDGNDLIVDGQKTWSSFADIADWQELLVRTASEGPASSTLTWIICPMNAVGVTVRPIRTITGSAKFCEVFYDSVRIPLTNVVGRINNGWRTAMSTLAFERGTASLGLIIGLSRRVDSMLQDCSAERSRIRDQLVALRAQTAAVRAAAYRVALDSEDSIPDAYGSIVRLSFAELTQQVTAVALDLYGISSRKVRGAFGLGYDYLDAFSETIAGGTAEIQRNIIGERLLGLPKGPR